MASRLLLEESIALLRVGVRQISGSSTPAKEVVVDPSGTKVPVQVAAAAQTESGSALEATLTQYDNLNVYEADIINLETGGTWSTTSYDPIYVPGSGHAFGLGQITTVDRQIIVGGGDPAHQSSLTPSDKPPLVNGDPRCEVVDSHPRNVAGRGTNIFVMESSLITNERLIIGLMCGTSGDGVSAAVIETHGYYRERTLRVLAHEVFPYPERIRDRLFSLFQPQRFTAADFGHLHRDLGEALADVALRILASAQRQAHELAAVAVHAPTLFHEQPAQGSSGIFVEIGESAIISERTGAVVVCDLRPNDVAAGGHGAPLSGFVDWVLLTDEERTRAVQNIGGIANVTFLPPGATQDEVVCFDTGPGNMVVDGVIHILSEGRETFDRDGVAAARGKIHERLLGELMTHPYLRRPIPKTSGREEFGEHFAEHVVERAAILEVDNDDLVATVTAYTVECIALHYDRELRPRGRLDEIVVYGGGTHNPSLLRMLKDRVAPVPVRLHDEFGIPGDAREAVTWAILADETLAGHPANMPAATGARHGVILGKLVSVREGGERWRIS